MRQVTDRYLPGLKVNIELVADIPLSGAGKRRLVVVDKPAASEPG